VSAILLRFTLPGYYCFQRHFAVCWPRMLDRSQHLKLFLSGSGDDNQEDVDVVLTDKRVQKELNRHPVNWERLFKAVRRVSHFKFNSAQEDHFMWMFSRYR
jgi:hypothetical protein